MDRVNNDNNSDNFVNCVNSNNDSKNISYKMINSNTDNLEGVEDFPADDSLDKIYKRVPDMYILPSLNTFKIMNSNYISLRIILVSGVKNDSAVIVCNNSRYLNI